MENKCSRLSGSGLEFYSPHFTAFRYPEQGKPHGVNPSKNIPCYNGPNSNFLLIPIIARMKMVAYYGGKDG